MIRDPRVETLTSWARSEGQCSERAGASLAALEETRPLPETAPGLAYAAAAAYARVPGTDPRDVRAGNRIVRVLAQLREEGARELLGMRDAVAYRQARRMIEAALAAIEKETGTPCGGLEDEFAGVELDAELSTRLPVGGYHAVLAVTSDLRRLQTTWLDPAGRESSRRPGGCGRLP